MKKRIITLGGLPGSGKSSTGKLLAERLSYARFSSGDLLRAVATARGISIDEISALAKTDPSIDEDLDAVVRSKATEHDLVIDSRLAFHWIPESFKVFLQLDLHTAAERTFAQIQKEGRVGQEASSVEEIYNKTVERIANEQKRYTTKYGIDYLDEKNYDLVVNTALHSLEEVVQIILEKYNEWLAQ